MTAIACDPGRERQGDEYSSPFSLLDPQCLCPDQISADDHCQRRVGGGVLIVGGIDHELSPVCPAVVGGVLRHVCEVAVLETEQLFRFRQSHGASWHHGTRACRSRRAG